LYYSSDDNTDFKGISAAIFHKLSYLKIKSNSFNSTSPKLAMLQIIRKQLSHPKAAKPND